MASQLGIYNRALMMCAERQLASLTEAVEARRNCDLFWNDNFINKCLEQGLWKFAIRGAAIEYDPSSSPPYGYSRAFTLPPDFIRTARLSQDERESSPIFDYSEEADFIYCDLDEIFIRYVSNDVIYGGNLDAWPETFTSYAVCRLAVDIAPKITSAMNRLADIKSDMKRALADARSKSAMEGPTRFPPAGSWSTSRSGRIGRRDRGSRGSLIG